MELLEIEDKLVYQKDGHFVGHIDYHEEEDSSVYINYFQIYKEYQTFGLGSEMLKEMISYFRKNGFKTIKLEAIPMESSMSITTLISFYMKNGFDYMFRGTNYLKLDLNIESFR